MDQKGKKGDVLVFVYAIVAIVVLAGILIWWHQYATGQLPVAHSGGVIHNLSNDQAPPGMPEGIVVANDAIIIHSYTSTTASGKSQSALIYTTTQSVNALDIEYSQYLVSNGWALRNSHMTVATSTGKTIGAPLSVNLLAMKSGYTLSIVISNTASGASTRTVGLNLSK